MTTFKLTIDLKGPVRTERDVASVLSRLIRAFERETYCFGTAEDDPNGIPPEPIYHGTAQQPVGSWSVTTGDSSK